MILDVVIEAGNPADAERELPMLERQIDIYGRPPRRDGRRRRLCQRRQPQGRQGIGRQVHGVPQVSTRAEAKTCLTEPTAASCATSARHSRPALSCLEAGLWRWPPHCDLEGPGPLQGYVEQVAFKGWPRRALFALWEASIPQSLTATLF